MQAMIPKFLLFLLLVFLHSLGNDTPKAPFTLAIVPTHSSEDRAGITMAYDTTNAFYVVFTNISDQPQSVWEYWNSWGYQTVSFEFTTTDGHKFIASRSPQGFRRNFPSTFVIQPGEHQVYVVQLDRRWEAHPALPKVEEMPITLKAVYEVSPTPEATQNKVWTGRIESKTYNLTLRHW